VFLMISRVTSTKLVFQFNEDRDWLSVIYYIEQGSEVF
jgi:hypothetical protein